VRALCMPIWSATAVSQRRQICGQRKRRHPVLIPWRVYIHNCTL